MIRVFLPCSTSRTACVQAIEVLPAPPFPEKKRWEVPILLSTVQLAEDFKDIRILSFQTTTMGSTAISFSRICIKPGMIGKDHPCSLHPLFQGFHYRCFSSIDLLATTISDGALPLR